MKASLSLQEINLTGVFCPKTSKLIDIDNCSNCEYFKRFLAKEGYIVAVMCKYPRSDKNANGSTNS